MIVQNNSAPWVILAVLVMAGCAISGMMMGNVGPFNSRVVEAGIPAQQTQGALDSQATQFAMGVSQTQQAPLLQQTAISAQMTLIPQQLTATQAVEMGLLQESQIHASQTAVVSSQKLADLSNNATATAIAREPIQDSATDAVQLAIVALGLTLVAVLFLTRAVIRIIDAQSNARAQEQAAQAKLIAEQRRLVALRASIETQKREQSNQYAPPASLMKKPNNGKGLPRAE